MATRIGCDHAVVSVLTEAIDGEPTYAAPKALPGVMQIAINPNTSSETLFADDGPLETAATLGNIEVTLERNAISNEEKALILGHQLDSNGMVIYGSNDVAPYVALGFRSLKSNGKYKYIWLYKGKFVDSEETYQTKGDTIEFQSDSITGNFTKLEKEYSVNGKSVYPYKAEMDEDAPGASESVIQKWFTAVVLPEATN